jgi:uncharacterized protein YndB with AHSA1/START domain
MISEHIKSVNLKERFDVSPEMLFDYWTAPGLARKWLFVGPSSHITEIEMHLVPRGRFKVLEVDTDREDPADTEQASKTFNHFGEYHVIEKPGLLEFTLSSPQHFAAETSVLVKIEAEPGGCRMELIQTGVDRETVEKWWKMMFENLRNVMRRDTLWGNAN